MTASRTRQPKSCRCLSAAGSCCKAAVRHRLTERHRSGRRRYESRKAGPLTHTAQIDGTAQDSQIIIPLPCISPFSLILNNKIYDFFLRTCYCSIMFILIDNEANIMAMDLLTHSCKLITLTLTLGDSTSQLDKRLY